MTINYEKPLTRRFIEKNRDIIDWGSISQYQVLSESFIEKFKDRVYWGCISRYQNLSEAFIEKYQDKVNWDCISTYQELSEDFIEKFKDKVEWEKIYRFQKISEDFIKRHKHKDYVYLIPNQKDNRSLKIKMKDMKDYAKKHNLEIKNDYLYAYRQHDNFGRGMFNPTIFYNKPGVYRDWKCNLDKFWDNSYGLGIFPDGNVKVRVHVNDWGIWARYTTNKARVWAFELLGTQEK